MKCVFCEIIAGREPGKVLYQDDKVVAIENKLKWAPVMILVMPRKHVTQEEMWKNDMDRIGALAMKLGAKHCPNGFRLLSNVGWDAMQTQEHGHLHVIGGMYLGPYA